MSVIGHAFSRKSGLVHSKDLYWWEPLYKISIVERNSIFQTTNLSLWERHQCFLLYWKKALKSFSLLIVIHKHIRPQHTRWRCMKIEKCTAKITLQTFSTAERTHMQQIEGTHQEKYKKKNRKRNFYVRLKPSVYLWSPLCACCCLWFTPYLHCWANIVMAQGE